MLITEATPIQPSEEPSLKEDGSIAALYKTLLFGLAAFALMTLGVTVFALYGGWFRAPSFPSVIVPLEWPQEIVVTGVTRHPTSPHG